jgi:hypothetical protein
MEGIYMTRLEVLDMAVRLTEAVRDGVITEIQARNQFKIVLAKHRQSDRFKELQKRDPKTWVSACALMGVK